MPYYRLYFLDRRGRFGRVEDFLAQDDEAAIRLSEDQREPVMELWCGGRRVKQWQENGADA